MTASTQAIGISDECSAAQEGDCEAASVASVPAQTTSGQGAAHQPAGKDATAARMPIKEDFGDGEAHHRWPDGSEYFGEWHDGQPNGRGIFVQPSGKHHTITRPCSESPG